MKMQKRDDSILNLLCIVTQNIINFTLFSFKFCILDPYLWVTGHQIVKDGFFIVLWGKIWVSKSFESFDDLKFEFRSFDDSDFPKLSDPYLNYSTYIKFQHIGQILMNCGIIQAINVDCRRFLKKAINFWNPVHLFQCNGGSTNFIFRVYFAMEHRLA